MSHVTDFAVYFMFCLVFFLGGYGLALFQKGITINVNKDGDQSKEIKPNPSMAHNLDPKVRHYYEQNHGNHNF